MSRDFCGYMEESGVSQETCIYWKLLQVGPEQQNIVRNLKFASILNVKFTMENHNINMNNSSTSLVCRTQNCLPAFVHAGIDNVPPGARGISGKFHTDAAKVIPYTSANPFTDSNSHSLLFKDIAWRWTSSAGCQDALCVRHRHSSAVTRTIYWEKLLCKQGGSLCTLPRVTILSWQNTNISFLPFSAGNHEYVFIRINNSKLFSPISLLYIWIFHSS